MGLQSFARARIPLVDHTAGEMPSPQDQASGDAMHDHIAFIHAEVQERLRAVLVQHKDRRLLGFRRKGESRVYAIIGCRDGLEGRIPAVPVIDVPHPVTFGRESAVTGLTSAATIWVVASIGLVAGAGFPLLAFLSSWMVVITLTALATIEERYLDPAKSDDSV